MDTTFELEANVETLPGVPRPIATYLLCGPTLVDCSRPRLTDGCFTR